MGNLLLRESSKRIIFQLLHRNQKKIQHIKYLEKYEDQDSHKIFMPRFVKFKNIKAMQTFFVNYEHILLFLKNEDLETCLI